MRKIIPIILFAIATMVSCSTLDCPLNNTVYTKYKLDGNVTQLTGSYMTISTNKQDGEDSILINKDENVDSFMLPMSYTNAADTLYFEIQDAQERVFKDTLIVSKDNHPHFESIDCSPSYFHTITGVTTTHHLIDSVVINHKDVNFDATKSHFLIYFGTRDLGKADAKDEGTNLHYKTSAPYGRIGLDWNLMKNKHDIYRLYGGLRYAFTSYKYDLTGPEITDPIWGTTSPYEAKDISCNYHWMEILFGVDAKIWGPIRMGWSVRYKRRIAHNDGELGNAWYVPGFGKQGNSRFGGTFNIAYEF